MDFSFLSALIPFNTALAMPDAGSLADQMIAGCQAAFQPDNLPGTLLLILGVLVVIGVMFPVIRFLLRMCSKLWQAVLLVIALIWIGTVATNVMAYAATASDLISDLNVGLSADMIGQVSVIVGVLVAYLMTPRKFRMF